MEIFPLILVGVIVAVILWYPLQLLRNPGSREYFGEMSDSRVVFMERAFDISRSESEAFRFDGSCFHHRSRVPYQEYSGVIACGSEMKTIRREFIPHETTWRYSRVDGGPDRRYANNYIIRRSRLHYIKFIRSKDSSSILHVYTYPEIRSLDTATEKFNRFLCGAKDKDYEEQFSRFNISYVKRIQAQESLRRSTQALEACEETIRAFQMIPPKTCLSDTQRAKVTEARERREKLVEACGRLKRDVETHRREEDVTVATVQAQVELAVNLLTIDSFS